MITGVKGTQDLFFPEIKTWQRIESLSREIFSLYGYSEIRTPALEHTELFVRGIGDETDIVSKEMYTFLDKKGRSLTLRPENTAPAMRAVIEHRLHESARHSRLYYIGPQFRYERPQKGRYRQFHQIGIEALGDPTPRCDFECIDIGKELISRLGIAQIEVRLNSVGCPVCRPQFISILKEALNEKSGSLCQDCRRRLESNPLRVLDCKVPSCQPVLAEAPRISDYLCESCGEHFSELKELLTEFEVPFTVYPRLVRGLDYYLKTVFEIVSPLLGAQDALVGGGRYDGLLSQLGGPSLPSFGWALGMERLAFIVPAGSETRESEVYIAWMGTEYYRHALKVASKLRENNIPVILDGEERSIKNSLKRADRLNVKYVVIVGEDEIKAGRLTVKNLANGEQSAFTVEELTSFLSAGISG
jgi:histidyl-tRNA synthetase